MALKPFAHFGSDFGRACRRARGESEAQQSPTLRVMSKAKQSAKKLRQRLSKETPGDAVSGRVRGKPGRVRPAEPSASDSAPSAEVDGGFGEEPVMSSREERHSY